MLVRYQIDNCYQIDNSRVIIYLHDQNSEFQFELDSDKKAWKELLEIALFNKQGIVEFPDEILVENNSINNRIIIAKKKVFSVTIKRDDFYRTIDLIYKKLMAE